MVQGSSLQLPEAACPSLGIGVLAYIKYFPWKNLTFNLVA